MNSIGSIARHNDGVTHPIDRGSTERYYSVMNSTTQGRILNPRYEFYTPLWIGVVPRGTTPYSLMNSIGQEHTNSADLTLIDRGST